MVALSSALQQNLIWNQRVKSNGFLVPVFTTAKVLRHRITLIPNLEVKMKLAWIIVPEHWVKRFKSISSVFTLYGSKTNRATYGIVLSATFTPPIIRLCRTAFLFFLVSVGLWIRWKTVMRLHWVHQGPCFTWWNKLWCVFCYVLLCVMHNIP